MRAHCTRSLLVSLITRGAFLTVFQGQVCRVVLRATFATAAMMANRPSDLVFAASAARRSRDLLLILLTLSCVVRVRTEILKGLTLELSRYTRDTSTFSCVCLSLYVCYLVSFSPTGPLLPPPAAPRDGPRAPWPPPGS